MREHILSADLNDILERTRDIWDELHGSRIFLTGGTGFIGTWLLESFVWAVQQLKINLSVIVLTRDAAAFMKKVPHLANHPIMTFQTGDVRDFSFLSGEYPYIIHGATEADAKLNRENPQLMLDTILQGTQRVLEFARQKTTTKFLFISSGAVYGKQPLHIKNITEDYPGAPSALDLASAYGIGKHTAEHMCILNANRYPKIQIKIARCFAFVGPYLPLDKHFAVGNFIRDGFSQNKIQVNSDGTTYRSYQYASELVIWLLHILCRGQASVPYNVGSSDTVSIYELAQRVADCFPHQPCVQLAKPYQEDHCSDRYVPSVQRAKESLGLANTINLTEALHKTIQWHQHRMSRGVQSW